MAEEIIEVVYVVNSENDPIVGKKFKVYAEGSGVEKEIGRFEYHFYEIKTDEFGNETKEEIYNYEETITEPDYLFDVVTDGSGVLRIPLTTEIRNLGGISLIEDNDTSHYLSVTQTPNVQKMVMQ